MRSRSLASKVLLVNTLLRGFYVLFRTTYVLRIWMQNSTFVFLFCARKKGSFNQACAENMHSKKLWYKTQLQNWPKEGQAKHTFLAPKNKWIYVLISDFKFYNAQMWFFKNNYVLCLKPNNYVLVPTFWMCINMF